MKKKELIKHLRAINKTLNAENIMLAKEVEKLDARISELDDIISEGYTITYTYGKKEG